MNGLMDAYAKRWDVATHSRHGSPARQGPRPPRRAGGCREKEAHVRLTPLDDRRTGFVTQGSTELGYCGSFGTAIKCGLKVAGVAA